MGVSEPFVTEKLQLSPYYITQKDEKGKNKFTLREETDYFFKTAGGCYEYGYFAGVTEKSLIFEKLIPVGKTKSWINTLFFTPERTTVLRKSVDVLLKGLWGEKRLSDIITDSEKFGKSCLQRLNSEIFTYDEAVKFVEEAKAKFLEEMQQRQLDKLKADKETERDNGQTMNGFANSGPIYELQDKK